ncbi:MAG TPA: hypothetical protein VFD88_02690, partial [Clostridia bacterium]|nr:hypothetical protein [Clostridia bacterium]
LNSALMDSLPPDFAETLARVVEPGHEAAVAEVIEAATRLDDEGLQRFLEQFAARVRSSPAPLRHEELRRLLRESNT